VGAERGSSAGRSTGEAAAASDYQALRELDTELREVIAQRQTLEEEWLAAAEAAE
jgi:ATP-binding cassette subfamily F protein uup